MKTFKFIAYCNVLVGKNFSPILMTLNCIASDVRSARIELTEAFAESRYELIKLTNIN